MLKLMKTIAEAGNICSVDRGRLKTNATQKAEISTSYGTPKKKRKYLISKIILI